MTRLLAIASLAVFIGCAKKPKAPTCEEISEASDAESLAFSRSNDFPEWMSQASNCTFDGKACKYVDEKKVLFIQCEE